MVEEAGEADAVVCYVRLFADDDYIVLAGSCVELEEFLSLGSSVCQALRGLELLD